MINVGESHGNRWNPDDIDLKELEDNVHSMDQYPASPMLNCCHWEAVDQVSEPRARAAHGHAAPEAESFLRRIIMALPDPYLLCWRSDNTLI